MRILSVILVALVISAAVAQEDEPDQYLCIADQATGFIYEDGRWHSANFDVGDNKYIVRRARESDGILAEGKEWGYAAFGTENFVGCDQVGPSFTCALFGEKLLGIFVVNLITLRYQKYYPFGYTNGRDSPDDTPYIEIGKCGPL